MYYAAFEQQGLYL